MQTPFTDQIVLKNNEIYFQDAFGEMIFLPNLTSLWQLYHTTDEAAIRANISPIFKEDLGTLLVVEIMIDATHEVTINRLRSGEIHKNMKHVHDYYIIPRSHFALAKQQYLTENMALSANVDFTACHFSLFPFGLAIVKAAFPDYFNPYTSTVQLALSE